MTPTTAAPPLLTADEFADRYAGESNVELVAGRPRKLPMPQLDHGYVCGQVARHLLNHVAAAGTGRVFINDTFVRVGSDPDEVRGADVAYMSFDKLPRGGKLPKVLDGPELVVEVKSPTDRHAQVVNKAFEYLLAGVAVVVAVDPVTESAAVFRPDEFPLRLHNGDELTLPDVLPGFAVPVRAFFA